MAQAMTEYIRGSHWSESELRDGWGPETDAETVERMSRLVVERFEELAAEAGFSAIWIPQTSNVIGPAEQTDRGQNGDLLIDLGALREQATAEIWERFCDGEFTDA